MSKQSLKKQAIKNLQTLRNIGPATAKRLYAVDIKSPGQLKRSNLEKLYETLKRQEGGKLDRCVLYVLRGAVLDVDWWQCQDSI